MQALHLKKDLNEVHDANKEHREQQASPPSYDGA